jgi:dihydroorotate dehydrogenase (NAD+) catalytic subunit
MLLRLANRDCVTYDEKMQDREHVPSALAAELGGLPLKNPVICGSGEHVMTEAAIDAAIDAGVAAVVAKSAGASEAARRQLDSATYVLLDGDWSPAAWDAPPAGASLLNRSGLVDMPFEEWAQMLARADRRAAQRGAYVVGSVLPAMPEQAPALAASMAQAGVRWIELNLSAPHATEAGDRILRVEEPAGVREIVRSVRAAVDATLTVKLTSETADVAALAAAACDGGADSVCLCGRRMGFLPDPDTGLPVLGTFGAFGGGWELPLTLRWIAKTRARSGPALPILGTGGARCGLDVVRFLLAGASAVQLTTVVYAGGTAALERVLAQLTRHLRERSTSVAELVGAAADAVLTYDEAASVRRRP